MHFRQIHNVKLPDYILDSAASTSKGTKNLQAATPSNSPLSNPQAKVGQFKCNHCTLSFDTATALESHGKLHIANMSGFNCAVCGAWQQSFFEYTEHLNSHRLNLESSKPSIPKQSYSCDTCNVSFSDVDLFRGHCHSVAHKISVAENEATQSKRQKVGDLKNEPGATPGQGRTTPYYCDICDISFARQTFLQQHLLSTFHQRSVKRLQDSLIERGRQSIFDSLQQTYQTQMNPLAALNQFPNLDFTAAANALNPLLNNQLLASLASAAFPSTPAASLWSSSAATPAVSSSLMPSFLQTAFASSQSLPKKSPSKQQVNANTASASVERNKSHPKLLKLLENVGDDVVKSRLFDLSASSSSDPNGSIKASSSSSIASCTTCTSLHDLNEPLLLKEHHETSHGLSITAEEVEQVITNHPDVFGSKLGEEFKHTVKAEVKEEAVKTPSPEETDKSNTKTEESSPKSSSNESPTTTNSLDPLISLCAAAGLLSPGSIPSVSQPLPIASIPASTIDKVANDSGRTKITDEQRAIFREYFNINNLPSDEEMDEICRRTKLGRKVVKHWFRNTLFKERQKNQNSPYNLNVPPTLNSTSEGEEEGKSKIQEGDEIVMVKTEQIDNDKDQLSDDLESEPGDGQVGDEPVEDVDDDDEGDRPASADGSTRSFSPSHIESRQTGSSWRRASRTKFSDYQLQSLMEAFERNAYPREEDQKRLSKQLGLSQRVIIVWFQNQRQKTRRSSQGSVMSVASSGRGSNEADQNLVAMSTSITHSTSGENCCENEAQTGDNENDEDSRLMVCDEGSSPSSLNPGTATRRSRTTITSLQFDILFDHFKQNANPTKEEMESICSETGLEKRTVQVWFQNQRSRERKLNNSFQNAAFEALLKQQHHHQQQQNHHHQQQQGDFPHNDESMVSVTSSADDEEFDIDDASSSNNGYNGNSKSRRRFRTQLSQVQIKIMRSIFEHYKTPSQSDCISLGKAVISS